jgi:hypothetical protein
MMFGSGVMFHRKSVVSDALIAAVQFACTANREAERNVFGFFHIRRCMRLKIGGNAVRDEGRADLLARRKKNRTWPAFSIGIRLDRDRALKQLLTRAGDRIQVRFGSSGSRIVICWRLRHPV